MRGLVRLLFWQEDHTEEMLHEHKKVMPSFASTNGCFIYVYVCVSEEGLNCLCYRLHDYYHIYGWNKALFGLEKS